jgi:DNA-binding transcriptional regulator YiaG
MPNNPTQPTRSERMARLIRESGLTHRQLAELCGASKRTVDDWATGRRQPTEPTLRLAESLLAKK